MGVSTSKKRLEVIPIPPDTVASAKTEVEQLVRETLEEAGYADKISEGALELQVEKTFPTDEVIIIVVTFLTKIALKTFNGLVLPKLQKRFQVRELPPHGEK